MFPRVMSGGTRNFHLGAVAQGGLGTEVSLWAGPRLMTRWKAHVRLSIRVN